MSIVWKPEFSVNVTEIDNQHKKLIEIGSRLQDISKECEKYDCFDDMINIIHELKDYTIYHFKYEEELMLHNGYTDFWEHKSEHVSFVNKIKSIDLDKLDRDQLGSIIDLIDFILNWVADHILVSDMKYKPFFNGIGIY